MVIIFNFMQISSFYQQDLTLQSNQSSYCIPAYQTLCLMLTKGSFILPIHFPKVHVLSKMLISNPSFYMVIFLLKSNRLRNSRKSKLLWLYSCCCKPTQLQNSSIKPVLYLITHAMQYSSKLFFSMITDGHANPFMLLKPAFCPGLPAWKQS